MGSLPSEKSKKVRITPLLPPKSANFLLAVRLPLLYGRVRIRMPLICQIPEAVQDVFFHCIGKSLGIPTLQCIQNFHMLFDRAGRTHTFGVGNTQHIGPVVQTVYGA